MNRNFMPVKWKMDADEILITLRWNFYFIAVYFSG